jgi:hypothetical protein
MPQGIRISWPGRGQARSARTIAFSGSRAVRAVEPLWCVEVELCHNPTCIMTWSYMVYTGFGCGFGYWRPTEFKTLNAKVSQYHDSISKSHKITTKKPWFGDLHILGTIEGGLHTMNPRSVWVLRFQTFAPHFPRCSTGCCNPQEFTGWPPEASRSEQIIYSHMALKTRSPKKGNVR